MDQRLQRASAVMDRWRHQARQTLVPMAQRARRTLPQAAQRVQKTIRQGMQHPRGRIILGAVAALVVLVAAFGIIGVNYVFGGADSVYNGPITAPTLVPGKGQLLFTIDPATSKATFTMHEVLFGNPKSVVGATNQIAGEILVDPNQPSHSMLSTIEINLTTLATDNPKRNHTMQSRILETYLPANQLATFVPTSFSGMPSSVKVGQTFTFQLHGNLTVHQVTRPETFTVTVKVVSMNELTGTATTTVQYKDFDLAIPNLPFLSDVSNTTVLTLDFTAKH